MTDALKFKKPTDPPTTGLNGYHGDLTTHQAAKYLNVSEALLEKLRCKGGGPAYLKYSERLVRYRRDDLDTFRDQFRREG